MSLHDFESSCHFHFKNSWNVSILMKLRHRFFLMWWTNSVQLQLCGFSFMHRKCRKWILSLSLHVHTRDANLWRPKIWILSFFSVPPTPPPPEFQRTSPPPKNWPSPQWEWLRIMMSYMMYTLSKFEIIVLILEIIFVND